MKCNEIMEGLLTNATERDVKRVRDWMLANGFEADPIQPRFVRWHLHGDDELFDYGFDASYVPKNRRDRFKKMFKSELVTVGVKPITTEMTSTGEFKRRKVLVLVFKDHQGSLHYTAEEVIDEIRRYFNI